MSNINVEDLDIVAIEPKPEPRVREFYFLLCDDGSFDFGRGSSGCAKLDDNFKITITEGQPPQIEDVA